MQISNIGFKPKLQKAGLVAISILLSFLLTECLLRLFLAAPDNLYVWQPYLHHTFHPDNKIFYGIKGESDFTINSQGVRGDRFEGPELKFLCVGGSTTECLYLDNKEAWHHQFQDSLNATFKIWKFQIGNIGKSGCTSRENFIHLKYFAPQLGKIDGVVMMVGLNDMMKRLSRDTLFENDFRFTPAVEDSFANAILLSNKPHQTWWRNLKLIQLVQKFVHATQHVEWQNVQDDTGETLKQWRENRNSNSQIIDSLPDLKTALDEFERNLDLIYNETQKQKIKMVLVNQAALYKDTMSEEESKLLWMGGVGNFQTEKNHAYYSAKALNKALGLYNERMKKFCSDKPYVQFVDLASQLPKDTSVFYDDCHFNESGARKVAAIIAQSFPYSAK